MAVLNAQPLRHSAEHDKLKAAERGRDANREGATRGRDSREGTFGQPSLKPYWGNPAVRNFRGDDGNVGIIRSPVRAIVLPDRQRVRNSGRLSEERAPWIS